MEINKLQNLENTTKTGFKRAPKGEPVEKMDDFINNFINRAEFELSDVGYFREISAEFQNDNPLRYIGKIGLKLNPENSSTKCTNRVLEVVVTDEQGKYETSKILKNGSRDELLNYLKSGDALNSLENYVTETSDRFFARDNL